MRYENMMDSLERNLLSLLAEGPLNSETEIGLKCIYRILHADDG